MLLIVGCICHCYDGNLVSAVDVCKDEINCDQSCDYTKCSASCDNTTSCTQTCNERDCKMKCKAEVECTQKCEHNNCLIECDARVKNCHQKGRQRNDTLSCDAY